MIEDLGPQLFNVEHRPEHAARARGRRDPAPAHPGDRHLARRARPDSRPSSPTTSSATDRSSGCSPTTPSPRSWSTGPTTSGSSARASSAPDRRRFSDESHLRADHQQDRRPGRPAGRRVLADGRRPAARRQPHQRDHPAALAAAARWSRSASSRASGSSFEDLIRLGTLTPETAEFLERCVQARLNILISGGTGTGKTTLLNVLSERDPRHRADRDDRGLPPSSGSTQRHTLRLESRPAEHRGRGRGHDPRPRAQLPAHASRPDHRRRGPRRRGARHAPGDEHRPRRLALDRPRQHPPRRARPARDDGADGRLRPAAARRSASRSPRRST